MLGARKMIKLKKILLLSLVTSYGLLVPLVLVHAAIVPACNPIPNQEGSCGVRHLFQLLVNIYNFLLGLAAFVAIIMIVGAGIYMLIFHYLEQPESHLENARYMFSRAVTGFVLVAVAYLIVNTLIVLLTGTPMNLTDYIKQIAPGSL